MAGVCRGVVEELLARAEVAGVDVGQLAGQRLAATSNSWAPTTQMAIRSCGLKRLVLMHWSSLVDQLQRLQTTTTGSAEVSWRTSRDCRQGESKREIHTMVFTTATGLGRNSNQPVIRPQESKSFSVMMRTRQCCNEVTPPRLNLVYCVTESSKYFAVYTAKALNQSSSQERMGMLFCWYRNRKSYLFNPQNSQPRLLVSTFCCVS